MGSRRVRIVRTSLAALMSAALIVVPSVMAVGRTAQAAVSGSESAGRAATSGTAKAPPTTPCVVSSDAPTCESTDPDLTIDVSNSGDTTSCTFTYSIDWGDGSPAQTATNDGEPASGDYYLADHTYQTGQTQTYSPAVTLVSITGGCTSGSWSYTFTLDVVAAVPNAPSNLAATAVDPNDIRLTWQDNSDNETGFEINNGVTSTDVGANSTSYTWGGLSPNTYMCFKVRAYNDAGDSAWDPNVSPWYVCATTPKPSICSTFTPNPTIYWSQIAGPQGTLFSATGNGWYPKQTVTIHLPSGKIFKIKSTSWRADSSGGWHVDIRALDSAPVGNHKIVVTQSVCGGLRVPGGFKVTLTTSQYAKVVSAIHELVSGGNSVCHILKCSKSWNNSMASKAIQVIDTVVTVFYEAKAVPESIKVGNDLKALNKALKKANGNKKDPGVRKAAKQLKADTVTLENTLTSICPPLELIFPAPS